MNPFALDSADYVSQDITAEANPAPREKLPAAWYEGVGTGLTSGFEMGLSRKKYSLSAGDDAAQQQTVKQMQKLVPDPQTVGVVGQIANGLADQLSLYGLTVLEDFPSNIVAAPWAIREATKTYGETQEALHIAKGVDPATAQNVARTEGASYGIGLVLPAAVPGKVLMRSLTGGAINVTQNQISNAFIFNTLQNAGYKEMAQQYRPFESTGLVTDFTLGALFGGFLGPRRSNALQTGAAEEAPVVNPSDLAASMTMNSASHIELGTAPGIPTDPGSRNAHVGAVDKALDDLMNDRPVDVGPAVTESNFIDNPETIFARTQISNAVSEHVGDLFGMQQELAQRGLPTDPTLYSIVPERVAPVRVASELRTLGDRARVENWDTVRMLEEIDRINAELANRADQRATAEASRERVRGALWVEERLTRAERNGELTPEAVSLAKWLISKNPNVANDLGLSITSKAGKYAGEAAGYEPFSRIASFIAGKSDAVTAVHEILHHTERMLPEPVREGLRRMWLREIRAAEDWAKRTQNDTMRIAIADALRAATGDKEAFARMAEMISKGQVSENFYQLANPSEYWAVNASRILHGRKMAADAGWIAQAKQWVKEFIEKVKELFGLRNNADVIRGIEAVLKTQGDLTGMMLSQDVRLYYAQVRPGVEAPGKGVAAENLNGFEPDLRVKVPIGRMKLPEKPLVLTGTNIKNATRQVEAIDDILAKFPDADESPLAWSKMMAYAMATNDVPIPPYRFLSDINSDGAFKSLSRLSKGQIADADHGFENARMFREAYISKELDVETTGKLFMWSFLSRGVSPYVQEGLFIDAFPGVDKWIKKAAAGKLTEADFPAYEKWAKSVAPQGSGQPGSGATHNLNAFGKLFLFKMGQRGEDGVSLLQHMHNMMEDPTMTGQQIRRWFIQNTEGVGIDNKVVSFTLLVAGFDDVMVLDRVQIRQLWDDGRFAGKNLYDGRKVDGKPVAGSMLSEITYGARGLLIYEAIERALAKRIDNLYASLGRPEAASVGRYHWETWVADSQQEASHGTLDAILHDAKGDSHKIAEVTAKEGEYGAYQYGARYGRDSQGKPYFAYTSPLGNEYRFEVPAFREFMQEVKSPKNKVVPTGFKVTEAGNAPWYERPEVNKQAIDELAQRFAGKPGAGEGAGAVQTAGKGQAVSDQLGRGADPYAPEELVKNNPSLEYVSENGTTVPAARALAQADAEIARAQQDSQGFDAAVACALRG